MDDAESIEQSILKVIQDAREKIEILETKPEANYLQFRLNMLVKELAETKFKIQTIPGNDTMYLMHVFNQMKKIDVEAQGMLEKLNHGVNKALVGPQFLAPQLHVPST